MAAIQLAEIKQAIAQVDADVDAWGQLEGAAMIKRDEAAKADEQSAAAKAKMLGSMLDLQKLLDAVQERNPSTPQTIVDLANDLSRGEVAAQQ